MGYLFSGDLISGSQEYQILHGKMYLVVSILVVVGYDFALDYDILFSSVLLGNGVPYAATTR